VRIGLLLLGLVVIGAAAWLVLRPGVERTSTIDTDVTVACAGSTGLDADACVAWGDGLLAEGAPSTTFELEDVSRLELTRSGFGYGSCEARWFLQRYPDEASWTEPVACPNG
jgi:hypothetical protein